MAIVEKSLIIRGGRAQQLATEISDLTGKSVTIIVIELLEKELRELKPKQKSRQDFLKAMTDIRGDLPTGKTRLEIEADLYDENGLPN
ncbi:MAG: type II toxin-antitoxin system VapB family antitoxin [Bacteroidota bacterium]